MTTRIKSWIEAMRLRTLPVSIAGVLTAAGFNIADGTFGMPQAVLCLVFALLCQIASNFANEYFDYRAGRDRVGREGPRRGVTEGDINPKAMIRATFFVLCLAALVGLSLTYWGGMWLIAVGAAVFVAALAYSAGPYPLSTHCLGEVAVVFFFGIVPVTLTYYLQSHVWNQQVFLASVSIGLMGANVLVINNYRDIEDDRAVGKHTLANTLPACSMPILYVLNALVAALLMLPSWHVLAWWGTVVPAMYTVFAVNIAYRITKVTGHKLTPLLRQTAILMSVYALLFLILNITAHVG